MSRKFMRWRIPAVNSEAVERLASQLEVSPLLARLLVLRGMGTAEAAGRFLNPSLDQLNDPFLMADMDAAVGRLRQAVERREKILIYGDYDVDGSMAVVVLLAALRSLGADVREHIPDRFSEGYGMRAEVIERAQSEGVKVVLSVDTGIREHEVLSRARELGLDCIVTDHHLPSTDGLPPASAVLNPRRSDCRYPDKNLSGVGVAFKVAQALLGERMSARFTESYLKVVAIGTIADVVPLVGENRVIARFGLEGLRRPAQAGLAALVSVAGLAGRAPTAGDVAFRIAPRLNAAGRMDSARDVIRLLTTSSQEEAESVASRLNALNRDRQDVEDEILEEILRRCADNPQAARRAGLVFSGAGWHRGVIGIVAQRVAERFHRPALVVGVEDGVGRGSGRSIPGFHLLEALSELRDLFERFGGHAQAAGFTLAADRIPELERRFEATARATLRPEDLEPSLRVDAELSLDELDAGLFAELSALEPFGFGNPAPVLAARGARLQAPPRVLKKKHLKFRVAQGAKSFDALWWRHADRAPSLQVGWPADIAFTVEENEYLERKSLQLIVKDLLPAADAP